MTMPENVGQRLDLGSNHHLPGGMTVAKQMSPEDTALYPRPLRETAYTVAQHAGTGTREGPKRPLATQKYLPELSGIRSGVSNIIREGAAHLW